MIKKIIITCIFLGTIICVFTNIKVFSNEKSKKSENINGKLEQLNNIHKKINYFKEDYIDRYLSYKKKNKNLANQDIVLRVNIGLDQDFYTNVIETPNQNSIQVLVNKFYYLDKNYVPGNLEEIDNNYSIAGKYLVSSARISFEYLARQAKKDNCNIRGVSAYRSYQYQNNLYNNYIKQDGVKNADKYSARPGFSEHQTGLAIDIDNIETNYNNFENTKEYTWMQNNAYKYGFILRYPKGKEDITGYMYEPWHYRYVGVKIATYIHTKNISFEEYYFKFLDK